MIWILPIYIIVFMWFVLCDHEGVVDLWFGRAKVLIEEDNHQEEGKSLCV